ncbi:glycosyltransferase family 2 protein [Algoriphagus pacificus]|uniref:Glycosyltransferase family 2 protein n=1 Tax=Algoriphagus pacificus TaxID=2811234 RepID=A0ABS3CKE7_9BACT|nr:glycosyltransferase family A protein [Algoriphagus pacificus]MBN7817517.1 glycosyltransferase family 2 protein [Algoriphagus pacificus]
MPLISVIIPTYNRVQSLSSAIQSVLKQTFEDWELIIVDDGSVDFTAEVVSQYLTDSRISYFFQENSGVSAARNFGVKMAIGEWLIFLDSDDTLTLNSLTAFAEATIHDIHLIVGGINVISNSGSMERLPGKVKNLAKIPGAFCLKKTSFNILNGYDEDLSFGENTELFHRMRLINSEEFPLEIVTVNYHKHELGGSRNLKNMTNSNIRILEKHRNTLSNNMKHVYHQIIGVNQMRFRNYKEARANLWQAFLLKPYKVSTLFRFFISLFPFLTTLFYSSEVDC